ncbi:MAG: hypothetical protein GY795_06515 [Desulfobacterales bacterium]|nr:hypothetical protein [Desulfobacterales bacterium]
MKSDFEILKNIHLSYKKAGMWAITKAAYTSTSKIYYTILLWVSSITIIPVTIWIHTGKGPLLPFIILVSLFALFIYAFNNSLKFKYLSYYNDFGDEIKLYSKNRMYLRYLIFREKIQNLRGDEQQILKIKNILDSEPALDSLSVIMQHPITVTCIAFLTAIIGGASAQQIAWESGVMIYIALLLVTLIIFNAITVEIFRPQSYKNKELSQFLDWLSIDKHR